MSLDDLLNPLRRLHEEIRDQTVAACESTDMGRLAAVAKDAEGDTLYAVDRVSEQLLINFFESQIAPRSPVVLIGEGLENGGRIVLPRGISEDRALWRIIIDPIDGTRGLMYQKRSAWILTGVAPNRGPKTNLQDIQLALQTEIPLVKQHLSDVVWAFAGESAQARQVNRLTGEKRPITLQPSTASSIAQGFAMISRFFPGARDVLASIDEEIVLNALGPAQQSKAHCFEDQYICSGGQLFELMSGKDRFNADLRPLMAPLLAQRGFSLGICCHPYDLCTELIARQLGVIVTDEYGRPLAAPLDVQSNITWVGYANAKIRSQIEPHLQRILGAGGYLQKDQGA